MPTGFDDIPIFYSQDELAYLKGSPHMNEILKICGYMKHDYDLICEVIPEVKEFTLKEFKIVRVIAQSRLFGISINGAESSALVPIADMLNHRDDPQHTSWSYSDQNKGFFIQAIDDIKRGEQVYDSYGAKSNQTFFINYGFISLKNNNNRTALKV